TDVEVAARTREAHQSTSAAPSPQSRQVAALPDAQLKQVLADLRVLAHTDPTMATGGFTGSRSGPGGGGGRGTAGAPAAARGGAVAGGVSAPAPGARGVTPGGFGGGFGGRGGRGRGSAPVTIKLADGRQLTGQWLAQSDLDATMLAGGTFHLLAKEGNIYREKSVTPKSDWLNYHGSLSAGRYSELEQINTTNIQR